ncbi:hypothetical protein QBC44DRAFT_320194 [Cladorrhinum sp. PSN332]|nr:hypothetical protein QBC44DRAFT_320194 [Cladorrhinum sp. PSN332]
MMIVQTLFALMVVIPSVAAFPTYRMPAVMLKVFLENDDCIMPEDFTVQNLVLWLPAADNTNKGIINFQYTNNGTGIDSPCHYNSTSVNVAPEGLTERYACDDTNVQFIWQSQVGTNGSLTLIEKACPNSNMSVSFEASGSIRPLLSCLTTTRNTTLGDGQACVAERFYAGNFTSLQPTPSF